MSPLKCAFDVTSSKFLGFSVHHRGIKVDLAKIKVIIELSPQMSLKELKTVIRLAYLFPKVHYKSVWEMSTFIRLMRKCDI